MIRCSRSNALRAMTISVITIAKPEKIAPATKYGGKMVVCQPGMTETAKSKHTMVWTESTSGVERPARMQVGHLVVAPVARASRASRG